tara:strand:- start:1329 stop:2033 length:705 start_codon:yes stop_codon:yes gene_type:complete
MKIEKILVFIVTYNSSYRLKKILNKLTKLKKRIPFDILISDDCSTDDTKSYFPDKKNIFLNINRKNLGYGGNVKNCLKFAINRKYKYAVMIHGDNQYDAKYIFNLFKKISNTNYDAVTGSRMINPKNALNGKMPFYKFIGNFVLTKFFNLVFKTNFTDAHTGLWMYNLNNLNYNFFKDIDENFNFDNQLRIKLVKNKKQIDEIPIKTYYRNEKSSFHFIYALKFLLEVSKNIIK